MRNLTSTAFTSTPRSLSLGVNCYLTIFVSDNQILPTGCYSERVFERGKRVISEWAESMNMEWAVCSLAMPSSERAFIFVP